MYSDGMALLRKEMTPALLTKMKRAGCYHLSWGLESGCQRVLDLMQKRFSTLELATQVIRWTHDAGIQQGISLITGFPGETAEMFDETVAFVKEYQRYFHSVAVQPMYVLPNSSVHACPAEFGIDPVGQPDRVTWETLDGSNTYEERMRRVEKLNAALENKLLTIDR